MKRATYQRDGFTYSRLRPARCPQCRHVVKRRVSLTGRADRPLSVTYWCRRCCVVWPEGTEVQP